ncbi:MAG TPA: MFS transporter, partial [Verrucomicrobiae bacterium]
GIFWELFGTKNPIVDLPLLKNRSFLFVAIMMFITMFILQSTTQMMPQFVQQLLPYDATKAGLTLMGGGFVMMAFMPFVGIMVRKVQPKYMIAFGFILLACAMRYLATFNTNVSFGVVAMGRVFQACGLAFLFVPIQTLAYSNLPPEKSNNASALINLMRNLGGSVGISMSTTMLARRSQIHQDRVVSTLTPTSLHFQSMLHSLAGRFVAYGADSVSAMKRATAIIAHEVVTQATMLAYLDIFMVLMYGSLVAAALTPFLKKINLKQPSAR